MGPGVPAPSPRAVQDPDSVSPCGVGSATAAEATDEESIFRYANPDGSGSLCASAQTATLGRRTLNQTIDADIRGFSPFRIRFQSTRRFAMNMINKTGAAPGVVAVFALTGCGTMNDASNT
jgi:hypothetical protein